MCLPLEKFQRQTVGYMVQSCGPALVVQQYPSAKLETDLVALRDLSGNLVDQFCKPDICTVRSGEVLRSVCCICESVFYKK